MLEIEKQNLFKRVIAKVERINSKIPKKEITEKRTGNSDPGEFDGSIFKLLASFCHLTQDYLLALNILRKRYFSESKFIQKCISVKLCKSIKPIRYIMVSIACELEALYYQNHWIAKIIGEEDTDFNSQLNSKKRGYGFSNLNSKSNIVEEESCELLSLFDDFIGGSGEHMQENGLKSEELVQIDDQSKLDNNIDKNENQFGKTEVNKIASTVKFVNHKKPANTLKIAPVQHFLKELKQIDLPLIEKSKSSYSNKTKNNSTKSEAFVVISHKNSANVKKESHESLENKNHFFQNFEEKKSDSNLSKSTSKNASKEKKVDNNSYFQTEKLPIFSNFDSSKIAFPNVHKNSHFSIESLTNENKSEDNHEENPFSNKNYWENKFSNKNMDKLSTTDNKIISHRQKDFVQKEVCLKLAKKGENYYKNKESKISSDEEKKKNLPENINKPKNYKHSTGTFGFSTTISFKTNKITKTKEVQKEKSIQFVNLSKWEKDEDDGFKKETVNEIVDLIKSNLDDAINAKSNDQTSINLTNTVPNENDMNTKKSTPPKQRYKFKSWEPDANFTVIQKKFEKKLQKAENFELNCYTTLLCTHNSFTTFEEFRQCHEKLILDRPNLFPAQELFDTGFDPNYLFFQGLSFEIQHIVSNLNNFSKQFTKARQIVKTRLNDILQDRVNNKCVFIQDFGSFSTGLLTPFSDLDLAIRQTNSETREHLIFLLNLLQIELINLNFVLKQIPITTASIPVLKIEADPSVEFRESECHFKPIVIKTDIIVEQNEAFDAISTPFRTTEFVKWCVDFEVTFFEVVLLMKFSLSSNSLSNSYTGELKRRIECLFAIVIVLRIFARKKAFGI